MAAPARRSGPSGLGVLLKALDEMRDVRFGSEAGLAPGPDSAKSERRRGSRANLRRQYRGKLLGIRLLPPHMMRFANVNEYVLLLHERPND